MSKKENDIKAGGKGTVVFLTVCLIIAVAAGIIFAVQTAEKSRQQKEYEELAQLGSVSETEADEEQFTGQTEETAEEETLTAYEASIRLLEELGVPVPEKEVDIEALQDESNPDIYAWIYIPDTLIDYPVLQHETDNTYYLNYNIDGSKGYPGCIYTENYNSKDFTDAMTVIYGHNMKNGTMFAGLHKFEDKEFFDEHPYVYIYTKDRLLVYEIYASYIYSDEHILLNHDFSNIASFDYYLKTISEIREMDCNRRDGIEVTTDNKILTLSTCVSGKSSNRYIVQGVLLNED